MTEARTLRELATLQHLVRTGIELAEVQRQNRELEQAMTWVLHAAIPIVHIADGARQSWPRENPDGSDTIGGSK